MSKLPCLLRLCCSLDVYSSNVLALFVVLPRFVHCIKVNDGALYTSVGVPTVCICNGAASITGHCFNGCPSPWNGVVGNGVNVARVFLDHQGLSTDVDLSVSLNLTILVKPHREKASSRIVDRRQHPMYYNPPFIDRDTKFQSITRIFPVCAEHFDYLSEILNNGFTSNDKVLLVRIPGLDFFDPLFECLRAELLPVPIEADVHRECIFGSHAAAYAMTLMEDSELINEKSLY
ncbi:hypothetical protein AAG906_018465 [Vitis piasezkii]